ncbi:MAG TPA: radical SAM protein [Deltaproteobacteria bacterium]|nr:radical SAM protein [Deltaproteobacteria bacterium]
MMEDLYYGMRWKLRMVSAFIRGLYAVNVMRSPGVILPSMLTIKITDRCNYRCVMCNEWKIGDRAEELSKDAWLTVLDDFRDMGGFSVRFTGGEVFIRKDIYKIIAHAKSIGLRVSVATNGHFIEYSLPMLVESSVDHITVSLHGRKEIHDAIVGVEASYDAVTAAVERLVDAGFPTSIAFTVLKDNIGDIEYAVDLARRKGATIGFNIFDTNPYFFKDIDRSLAPSTEAMERVTRLLVALKKKWPKTVRESVEVLETIPALCRDSRLPDYYCARVLMEVSVDSFGNVYHGCWAMPSVGNLKSAGLDEICRSRAYLEQRLKGFLKECPGCTCGFGLDVKMNLLRRRDRQ